MVLNRTLSTTPTHLVGWEDGAEVYVDPLASQGSGAPTAANQRLGMYINTATGDVYINAGTALVPDWRLQGEFLASSILVANGVTVLTNTGKTVTSLALTAGEWDVSAILERSLAAVTATARTASLSLTNNTVAPAGGGSGLGTNGTVTEHAVFGATVTGGYTTVIPPTRVVFTATTTLYLVCHDVFSAGTVTAFGTLRARRIR